MSSLRKVSGPKLDILGVVQSDAAGLCELQYDHKITVGIVLLTLMSKEAS